MIRRRGERKEQKKGVESKRQRGVNREEEGKEREGGRERRKEAL